MPGNAKAVGIEVTSMGVDYKQEFDLSPTQDKGWEKVKLSPNML